MRLRSSVALALTAFLGIASATADETIVALEPAFPEMKFSLPVAISPLPGSKDAVFIPETPPIRRKRVAISSAGRFR
jgi:hypothetical protein